MMVQYAQRKLGCRFPSAALFLFLVTPFVSAAPNDPVSASRQIAVGGDRDYAPYEWLDENGHARGFNVDLMRAIGEIMGSRVKFRLGPWNEALQDLQTGEIDVLPMHESPQREETVDFSEPYAIVYYETYARRDGPSLDELEDLRGHQVIVQRESLTYDYLRQYEPGIELVLVDSEPDALRLLASGMYDYALVSQIGGLHAVKRYKLSNLTTTGPPLLPHGYVLAVRQGNTELRNQLNQALAILKATGRYSKIYNRWFGDLLASRMSFMMILSYAAWALAPLALIAIGALIWSGTLKRQVRQRTQALQHELTERKHAEQALRESEDRFRDATEAASDWIWEMDENLRFTYLSERFYEITRIAPEQVLGRARWELTAEDRDQSKWREHYQTLKQQLPFRDFVYKTQIADRQGHGHYFNISGKPVYDALGQFKGYRGMGNDITEKVEAEIALRESQRALSTLMDNLPGMAYRCRNDHHWTMELVSSGCYALTGYHPEDLIGNKTISYAQVIQPQERKRIWDMVQIALHEKRPFQFAYRIKTANGQEKWAWAQGCGVFSNAGELQALEGLVIDISEQKQAEEAMTRLRVYLRNIIDSMPSVLVCVNNQGRITEWNQAAEKLSGTTWEQAQGRFFGDIFPQLRGQLEQVRACIKNVRPIKTQRINTELEDRTHYADIMVYPLIASNPIGAVIRMDDVTARVRIEEMMVQTEKMLSIGGLAAGMAHEINNPLGIILQGTQNIRRRIAPELANNRKIAGQLDLDLDLVWRYLEARDILRFLDGIHEAGARAAKIVTDMLAFSRRSELRFDYLDVHELLDTVVRLAASDYDLKKNYDFKQIEIKRDYDPTLNQVKCDKTEIEQVILNLLKNAAQAMCSAAVSAPTITLRTHRERNYACIEIADNGPGMDEKTRKRAFEPFFTTKEVGVGTGLGLSVSYFIVTEQHRGTLSVTSKPGEGTRFFVRLPLGT